MWLFELGPDQINFSGNDQILKSLEQQEGPKKAQVKIRSNINNNGDLTEYVTYTYGTDQFYNDTNLVTLTLGSYGVNAYASEQANFYKITYKAQNTSSWESAIRFRIDNNGDGYHDGVIPKKLRGEGLHLGGNFKQTYTWEEEY